MTSLIARLLAFTVTPLLNLIYWISRIIPGFKHLPKISVPLRYAILTFLSLLVIALVLFFRYQWGPQTATIDNWWPIKHPFMASGLMLLIPVLVYIAVRTLMQGTVSQFPDIDFAWTSGLAALKNNGIDPQQTPIFLVLGNPDHTTALNVYRASRVSMNVKQVPEGPGALHFYANQEGIYIFLTNGCCLSKLASIAKASPESGGKQAPSAPSQPKPGYTGTIQAGSVPGGGGGGRSPMQTVSPGAGLDERTVRTDGGGRSSPGPSVPASAAAMQTMQASPMRSLSGSIPSGGGGESVQKPILGPADINHQIARLEYVCYLIRRLRNAVCPINGALVLLPFQLIEQAPEQFQAMVQRDLNVMRARLKLRFPVTVLVHELEREAGFRELVRRVGVERAKVQRFGKGADVWTPPSADRLEAVAKHACGAFEDWSYMLFREHDGLRKPGNSKLFSLLCRVRGDFVENLERILAFGFGENSGGGAQHGNELMFSGCYFAATGETEDRQAFVHSVLRKLTEQESELSWTDDAVQEDERLHFAANLFALVGIVSLAALLVMIAIDFKWFEGFAS